MQVSGLTSTSTGSRPAWMMAFTAPQNVMVDVRTRVPFGSFRARSDNSSAAVQEETAIAWSASTYAPNSFSNSWTCGPVVTHPDARTSATAAIASGEISVLVRGTFRSEVSTVLMSFLLVVVGL
jgi:hypothetical protein